MKRLTDMVSVLCRFFPVKHTPCIRPETKMINEQQRILCESSLFISKRRYTSWPVHEVKTEIGRLSLKNNEPGVGEHPGTVISVGEFFNHYAGNPVNGAILQEIGFTEGTANYSGISISFLSLFHI